MKSGRGFPETTYLYVNKGDRPFTVSGEDCGSYVWVRATTDQADLHRLNEMRKSYNLIWTFIATWVDFEVCLFVASIQSVFSTFSILATFNWARSIQRKWNTNYSFCSYSKCRAYCYELRTVTWWKITHENMITDKGFLLNMFNITVQQCHQCYNSYARVHVYKDFDINICREVRSRPCLPLKKMTKL